MDFLLRDWKQADAEDVVLYACNQKIAANLRDGFPYPYTLADAQGYIEACIKNQGKNQLCYAIDVNGEAVGSIGIFVKDDIYRKSAEIGYWLGEPFWKMGIMTEAIRQICAEGFQRFDIVRIFAEPYAGNLGSRKALKKAGFELEGILKRSVYKNGTLLDSCIYAKLK